MLKIKKVIIEGEVPKNCQDCPKYVYFNDTGSYCRLMGKNTQMSGRPNFCPLVTHDQAFNWIFFEAPSTPHIAQILFSKFGLENEK